MKSRMRESRDEQVARINEKLERIRSLLPLDAEFASMSERRTYEGLILLVEAFEIAMEPSYEIKKVEGSL